MIGLKTRVLICHYLQQGLSKAAIAKELGVNERTIRRWCAGGEFEHGDAPRYGPRPRMPRKIDPFLPILRARLEAFPRLSAVRLFEEVKAAGYSGGYSQLCLTVAQLRPRPAPEPLVRFETAPGVQAQVDFAEFTFDFGKRYALLVVLGYSRLLFLRFYQRQDMPTLFQGLEEAFTYFNGVPREVLFDQMKSVITADLRPLGGQLLVNEEFLRFARHWGFTPRACRPYRAKTKGKVERPIRYLRDNFVYGRTFLSDAHLEDECRRWLERTNLRQHRTTHERPRLRYERDEYAQMLPLAAPPYRSVHAVPVEPPTKPAVVQLKPTRGRLPRIEVEKRSLSVYAGLIDPQDRYPITEPPGGVR